MNQGAEEGKIGRIFVIPEFMQVKVGLDEAGNTGEDNGCKKNQAEDNVYIFLFHLLPTAKV